jgi:glyoxylase-like metal-dependent hydrolase (beta-lactamase superfamily II)
MSEYRLFERVTVGPLGVNCYLFGDPQTREAVCIDAGAEAAKITDAIHRHGLTIIAVLCTHAHADHILAAHDVSSAVGAPVLAPDGEQDLWATAEEFCTLWGFPCPQPPPPDEWIPSGTKLTLGDLSLEVVDVRGHSPAGVAFVTTGFAFAGDALFQGSIGRTDLPGQDHATLIDRIRVNLLSLPPNTSVWPGHGPETTVGWEAAHNPYLRTR